jgi:hypothetical protein
MWARRLAASLALAGATATGVGPPERPAAQTRGMIPQTEGWVLVVSRCVICHSVEVAVQQRQGPLGWGAIVDRMVTYGMPLEPHERQTLIRYLVRHYGDPDGR